MSRTANVILGLAFGYLARPQRLHLFRYSRQENSSDTGVLPHRQFPCGSVNYLHRS